MRRKERQIRRRSRCSPTRSCRRRTCASSSDASARRSTWAQHRSSCASAAGTEDFPAAARLAPCRVTLPAREQASVETLPQNVVPFESSEPARQLRAFVYEFWCEHGHGPNLRAVHEGTGLDRRTIIQSFKELQLGIICVVDQDSQNCNVLKFQPFSSFPSQVEVWVDGRFHSYAGCALESVAISRMPPFAGKELTLRSYCACCLLPIDLTAVDGVVTPSAAAASVLVH